MVTNFRMDPTCMIKHSLNDSFNTFVLTLIDVFSLEEICSNLFKSNFINIETVEMVYNIICRSNYVNSNMCLNSLFTKLVQYNIGNQIEETLIDSILTKIDLDEFQNHQCSYNYHNFRNTKCKFSIYSSLEMCLYYYINDTHLCYNNYISVAFSKKYLSNTHFSLFKKNRSDLLENDTTIPVDYHDRNHLLSMHNSDTIKKQISLNSDFMWKDIDKHSLKKIDINYIFLNKFSKQKRDIELEVFYKYIKYRKIYRWLLWVYWDPKSPFRIKKMGKEYDSLTG